MNLIGEVKGKDCIIIDDMIDTAGTLAGAARALAEQGRASGRGVRDPRGALGPGRAAHRRFAARRGGRDATRSRSRDEAKACPKIRQVSIARLLGEAIKRIHSSDSVSSLFA